MFPTMNSAEAQSVYSSRCDENAPAPEVQHPLQLVSGDGLSNEGSSALSALTPVSVAESSNQHGTGSDLGPTTVAISNLGGISTHAYPDPVFEVSHSTPPPPGQENPESGTDELQFTSVNAPQDGGIENRPASSAHIGISLASDWPGPYYANAVPQGYYSTEANCEPALRDDQDPSDSLAELDNIPRGCNFCENMRRSSAMALESCVEMSNKMAKFNDVLKENGVMKQQLSEASIYIDDSHNKIDLLKSELNQATLIANNAKQREDDLKRQLKTFEAKARESREHAEAANIYREKYARSCAVAEQLQEKRQKLSDQFTKVLELAERSRTSSEKCQQEVLALKEEKKLLVAKMASYKKYVPVMYKVLDALGGLASSLPAHTRRSLQQVTQMETRALLLGAAAAAKAQDSQSDEEAADELEALMGGAALGEASSSGMTAGTVSGGRGRGAYAGASKKRGGGVHMSARSVAHDPVALDKQMMAGIHSKLHGKQGESLDSSSSTAAPVVSTIHGKKGMTVREQQQQQLKGLSVKEKAAALRQKEGLKDARKPDVDRNQSGPVETSSKVGNNTEANVSTPAVNTTLEKDVETNQVPAENAVVGNDNAATPALNDSWSLHQDLAMTPSPRRPSPSPSPEPMETTAQAMDTSMLSVHHEFENGATPSNLPQPLPEAPAVDPCLSADLAFEDIGLNLSFDNSVDGIECSSFVPGDEVQKGIGEPEPTEKDSISALPTSTVPPVVAASTDVAEVEHCLLDVLDNVVSAEQKESAVRAANSPEVEPTKKPDEAKKITSPVKNMVVTKEHPTPSPTPVEKKTALNERETAAVNEIATVEKVIPPAATAITPAAALVVVPAKSEDKDVVKNSQEEAIASSTTELYQPTFKRRTAVDRRVQPPAASLNKTPQADKKDKFTKFTPPTPPTKKVAPRPSAPVSEQSDLMADILGGARVQSKAEPSKKPTKQQPEKKSKEKVPTTPLRWSDRQRTSSASEFRFESPLPSPRSSGPSSRAPSVCSNSSEQSTGSRSRSRRGSVQSSAAVSPPTSAVPEKKGRGRSMAPKPAKGPEKGRASIGIGQGKTTRSKSVMPRPDGAAGRGRSSTVAPSALAPLPKRRASTRASTSSNVDAEDTIMLARPKRGRSCAPARLLSVDTPIVPSSTRTTRSAAVVESSPAPPSVTPSLQRSVSRSSNNSSPSTEVVASRKRGRPAKAQSTLDPALSDACQIPSRSNTRTRVTAAKRPKVDQVAERKKSPVRVEVDSDDAGEGLQIDDDDGNMEEAGEKEMDSDGEEAQLAISIEEENEGETEEGSSQAVLTPSTTAAASKNVAGPSSSGIQAVQLPAGVGRKRAATSIPPASPKKASIRKPANNMHINYLNKVTASLGKGKATPRVTRTSSTKATKTVIQPVAKPQTSAPKMKPGRPSISKPKDVPKIDTPTRLGKNAPLPVSATMGRGRTENETEAALLDALLQCNNEVDVSKVEEKLRDSKAAFNQLTVDEYAAVMVKAVLQMKLNDHSLQLRKDKFKQNDCSRVGDKKEESLLSIAHVLWENSEEFWLPFVRNLVAMMCKLSTIDGRQCGAYIRLISDALGFASKSSSCDARNCEELVQYLFSMLLHNHGSVVQFAVMYFLLGESWQYLSWFFDSRFEDERILLEAHVDNTWRDPINWAWIVRFPDSDSVLLRMDDNLVPSHLDKYRELMNGEMKELELVQRNGHSAIKFSDSFLRHAKLYSVLLVNNSEPTFPQHCKKTMAELREMVQKCCEVYMENGEKQTPIGGLFADVTSASKPQMTDSEMKKLVSLFRIIMELSAYILTESRATTRSEWLASISSLMDELRGLHSALLANSGDKLLLSGVEMYLIWCQSFTNYPLAQMAQ